MWPLIFVQVGSSWCKFKSVVGSVESSWHRERRRYRYSGCPGERRNAVIDYTASWAHVSAVAAAGRVNMESGHDPGIGIARRRKDEEWTGGRIETKQSVLSNPTILSKGTTFASVFAPSFVSLRRKITLWNLEEALWFRFDRILIYFIWDCDRDCEF